MGMMRIKVIRGETLLGIFETGDTLSRFKRAMFPKEHVEFILVGGDISEEQFKEDAEQLAAEAQVAADE